VIPIARPLIGDEERAAVDRVLSTGSLAQGAEVAAFEAEFSDLACAGRTAVAVSNGTAAIHLLLRAHGIGPGDEVVVPSFTFVATANAVLHAGATPVFVDIDPATFTVAPDAVEAAIGPRTSAVLAVHLYGQTADADALGAICHRRGLALLEDAAQAHLATFDGRPAGTLGQGATFSIYPTKNMTTGEGGMVVVADEQVARTLRLLRNQGMESTYAHEIVGYNERMTDIAAAIGRVQLRALAGRTAVRQAHAARFDESLEGVTTPSVRPGSAHVYHQYTVRAADREGLMGRLEARGVQSRVYYPTPVHRLPPYREAGGPPLPETDRAAAEVLSLPVGPHLSEDDVATVIEAVNAGASR
jgi:dTDP-4-amino-4,6-dideoxygalactose transaminase